MKKRTIIAGYDKACQRLEAQAAALTRQAAGKPPHTAKAFLDQAAQSTREARDRLRRKQRAFA
jgi:hypothetical protein